MISSLDIALKIRQRLNKADTQDDENLPIYVIVEAYNKGQLNIVNKLSSKNNTYKTGVESTIFRIDDLQCLINSELKTLSTVKKSDHYLTELLPDDYLRYIRTFCIGKVPNCNSKEIFTNSFSSSNFCLNDLLFNLEFKCDFKDLILLTSLNLFHYISLKTYLFFPLIYLFQISGLCPNF